MSVSWISQQLAVCRHKILGRHGNKMFSVLHEWNLEIRLHFSSFVDADVRLQWTQGLNPLKYTCFDTSHIRLFRLSNAISLAMKPYTQSYRRPCTQRTDVCSARLATFSNQAFPAAAAQVWNSLSDDVTAALSITEFRRRLKTHHFGVYYIRTVATASTVRWAHLHMAIQCRCKLDNKQITGNC
jgi:hypothetical protein